MFGTICWGSHKTSSTDYSKTIFTTAMLNTTLLCQGTTVFRCTWNFEPSRGICTFLWNIYIFTEFCGFLYQPVIRGQIRHFWSGSGGRRKLITICGQWTWFRHEIHDCHSGRNIKNIDLSLSEILQVYLADTLSVVVAGDKNCTSRSP